MNGIQNGYKGIGVSIIGYTKHPAKVMWDMLKQTWIELQNIEYDPNLPIVREFITGSLERRLNPTPQETVMIQAVFHNISRVNLAQLTRHRGWLFQVESQMPQHVKHNMVLPLMEENLVRVKKDLDWLIAKYDFRNASKPWGAAQDALPRAMQKLEGIYPADKPYKNE